VRGPTRVRFLCTCSAFFCVCVCARGGVDVSFSFREVNAQTSPLEGHGVFVAEFPQGEDHHLGRTGGGHILGKVSEDDADGVRAKRQTGRQINTGAKVDRQTHTQREKERERRAGGGRGGRCCNYRALRKQDGCLQRRRPRYSEFTREEGLEPTPPCRSIFGSAGGLACVAGYCIAIGNAFHPFREEPAGLSVGSEAFLSAAAVGSYTSTAAPWAPYLHT